MSRVETVTALLERYNELVDPMQSGNGAGDTGLRLMPCTYTASVRELERLLGRMRDDRHTPLLILPAGEKASLRSCWWHVTERYIRATNCLQDVPAKRKTKHGKTVTVVERQRIPIHNPAVRQTHVDRGIVWLADSWNAERIGEPSLSFKCPECRRHHAVNAYCTMGVAA